MKLSFTQSPNGNNEAVFESGDQDPYLPLLTSLRITLTGTTIQEIIQSILNGINVCVEKKKKFGKIIRTDALREIIRVLEEREEKKQSLFGINEPNGLRSSIETVRTALTSALSDQTSLA